MLKGGDPFYTPVKETLIGVLCTISGREAGPEWMDCVARGCHVRTAAPLRWGVDAGKLAAILQEECCGSLYGVPLVERVAHNGGHLLFTLTPAYFTAAMEIALKSLPPAESQWGQSGEIAYACVRMQMLSRRPMRPCPVDPAVQMALWRALGIPERLWEPEFLRIRLREAARALLTMTHHLPPRERPGLLRQCGGVGEAAARLLSLGIEQSQGGAKV